MRCSRSCGFSVRCFRMIRLFRGGPSFFLPVSFSLSPWLVQLVPSISYSAFFRSRSVAAFFTIVNLALYASPTASVWSLPEEVMWPWYYRLWTPNQPRSLHCRYQYPKRANHAGIVVLLGAVAWNASFSTRLGSAYRCALRNILSDQLL